MIQMVPGLVRKTTYLVMILAGLCLRHGISQAPLSGIINDYTAIDTIYSFNNNNVDSLIVADASAFGTGDTVMVYCVRGAEIETSEGFGQDETGRDKQNAYNTGKYAFVIIDSVDYVRNMVKLNTTIRSDNEIRPFPKGDFGILYEGNLAQLIKVHSYVSAVVQGGGVTAPAWDGSTGGVVALFVHGALTLNGDIDVSGKGFRGAPGSTDTEYLNGCSVQDTALYGDPFYADADLYSGLKGEGTTMTTFDQTRGWAMNINGGGGGNGLFSGGGGGSNWSSGGHGGNESSQCGPGVETPGGNGGFDLSRINFAYYVNGNPQNRGNRIFFGGGGGAGTRTNEIDATDGGNGGGLVVIVADTIIGNGHWILADGENVTAVAEGAGGGGGGGGGIVLDVSGYKDTLNLSAVGGKGGDTQHPLADTTGPGGGGGGGVYWLAGNTSQQPGVISLTTAGPSGEHLSVPKIKYGAADGAGPGKINNLEAPIKGFLFNSVPDHFTYCSDVVPDTIMASIPKGGDGTYSYQWIDSSSTQQFWDIAPGVSDEQNYPFQAPLGDTTYYRRVVTSGLLLPDTSFRIAVYVHPAITGNTIAAPDTVCKGNAPGLFVHTDVLGGGPTGGSYTYQWKRNQGAGYLNVPGGTTEDYQSPGLDLTSDFVRVVRSGVCVDTSNVVKATVLEPLTGFQITPNDTVCFNTAPETLESLTGLPPANGDQNDLRYQWASSTDKIFWSDLPGDTLETFQPPALTQTTYYRRMVLSGSDDACVETSDFVEILNIPLVGNNTISETQTVCTNDQAALLTGTDPSGGYQGEYSYQWESQTKSTAWTPVTSVSFTKIDYDPGIMTGDTIWFHRIVGSGGTARNVCRDTSSLVTINILPSITGNMISTIDEVKCQGEATDLMLGSTPGGGATQGGTDPTRLYRWEVAANQDNPDTWEHPSVNGESVSYSDPNPLETTQDRWYRRIVFSGPGQVCKDTSNELRLQVHTQITGNTIEPADSVCFADTKILLGATPSGEPFRNPVYTWEDLDGGGDLPASNEEDFTTGPFNALGEYHFRRKVSIGECTDTSNSMTITVMELPGATLTDMAMRACEQDMELAVDLNVDELDTYVLPWQVTLKNEAETGIGPLEISADGTLPITLDIDVDSLLLNYELESVTYASAGSRFTCVAPPGNLLGVVPIHVFRRPEPQILVDGEARDSFKICNTTVTLLTNPDNGAGSWASDPPGTVFFTPGSQADEYHASIPNNHTDFGKYTLTFTSEAGDCAGEDVMDIHFFEQPAPAFAGEDTMLFLINSIQLQADPPTAGIGTWELVKGSGIIENDTSFNTFAYELGLGEENTFRWTVTNGEDEGTCVTTSDVTIVLRADVKRYGGFSPNGDASNQYFIMQGLVYADDFKLTIFNGLGNIVATITPENIDRLEVDPSLITNGLREDEMVVWDGTADNGNEVPSGTYYYVINYILYQRDNETGEVTREDTYEFTGNVVVARTE